MYHINSNLGIKKVATLGDVLVYMNRRDSNFERPNEEFHSVTRDGETLEIVRDSYHRYGIQQQGSAQAIMDAMVKEVELFYAKPGDRVYKPHEMTKSQWEAINAVGSSAYRVYPCFTAEQRQERCTYVERGRECEGTVEALMNHLFYERFGYLHNGPIYEPGGDTNARHEVHVAYALAQGKEVPPHVIAEYAGRKKGGFDMVWFGAVINVPKLRGAMPLEMFKTLSSLLSHAGIELTNDNADDFIALMKEFPVEHVNYVNMDDFLYEKGILKLRPLPEKQETDIGVPVNRFSADLYEALGIHGRSKRIQYLNKERQEGRMPVREYEFQKLLIEQEIYTHQFPNEVAYAVQHKNVAYLLDLIDSPDDHNSTTKAVLQKHFSVKIKGLKALARNKAIFALCGYDDAAREQYLQQQKDRKAKKDAERAEKEVIERAEQVRYQVFPAQLASGSSVEVLTAREYVDRAIAKGHTTIQKRRKGNTQYWLSNARSGSAYPLQAKDGSYDYAVIALEKAKAAEDAKKETAGE